MDPNIWIRIQKFPPIWILIWAFYMVFIINFFLQFIGDKKSFNNYTKIIAPAENSELRWWIFVSQFSFKFFFLPMINVWIRIWDTTVSVWVEFDFGIQEPTELTRHYKRWFSFIVSFKKNNCWKVDNLFPLIEVNVWNLLFWLE